MFLILSTYLQLLSQFNILIFSSWMDQCILEYRMAPLSNMTWYLAFAFPSKRKITEEQECCGRMMETSCFMTFGQVYSTFFLGSLNEGHE